MIRRAVVDDIAAVARVVIATKMFEPEDEAFLTELFGDYFASKIAEGHAFVVDVNGAGVQGMAYYQPLAAADQGWNLTMIAVRPDLQGHGLGRELMKYVEDELRDQGQRLLIVETSATAQYDRTRKFYAKQGYDEEARVRDYWSDADDLVIFRKRLTAPAPH
jgi:ribosomal protein S18 acetylase RimI-like enzyme